MLTAETEVYCYMNSTVAAIPIELRMEFFQYDDYNEIDEKTGSWEWYRIQDERDSLGSSIKIIVEDGVLAFYSRGISTLTIPDNLGITGIGDYVFHEDNDIEVVTIPNGVTRIGNSAFLDSSIHQVNLPEGLLEIGEEAFSHCSNLKTVVLPQSLEIIEDNAFSWGGLETINIPPRVTHIGDSAFDIAQIKTIYLPASVKSLGMAVFLSETLQEILVDEANPVYTSREGVLFSKDMTVLIAYPPGAVRDIYRVPDGVTQIISDAFGRSQSTSEVLLSEGLREISSKAFWAAEGLRSIQINSGIRIGTRAFSSCENLVNVMIPEDMKEIPDGLFANCSMLTAVQLPDSLEKIADGAFFNCTSLQNITLPDTLQYIGKNAFWSCSSLESISIPPGVEYIGPAAFAYCTTLGRVGFESENTSGTPDIQVDKTGSTKPLAIFGGAFKKCTSLESVTFPDNTEFYHETGYGYKLFAGCTALKEIHISREITQYSAFDNCPAQVLYK